MVESAHHCLLLYISCHERVEASAAQKTGPGAGGENATRCNGGDASRHRRTVHVSDLRAGLRHGHAQWKVSQAMPLILSTMIL